jgi:hypothetical protein
MQQAVNFLKELQSKGLILEMSRGVWLRAPLTSSAQTKGQIMANVRSAYNVDIQLYFCGLMLSDCH